MIPTARPASGRLLGRSQAALVAALLVLATLAWFDVERRMSGMSSAPSGDLGSVGSYTGVWLLMMAAMMFPSIAPMVVTYDRLRASRRARGARAPGSEGTAFFVAGYLIAWTSAGLFAYALLEVARPLSGGLLAWEGAGREFVAAVLLVSGAYQLTPLKDRCLARCRGPLMFILEHWREGRIGASRMGMTHGAWCVGCCWGLMATLFALGLMSLGSMAFVAALIAGEKLLPAALRAPRAVAVILLALGMAALLAPDLVPGLFERSPADMSM